MIADQLDFLQSKTFAVAGVSSHRDKYGNIVFRALLDFFHDDPERSVYPLNPKLQRVESAVAYASVSDVPTPVEALSIVTPPAVTRQIVNEAIDAGVKKVWMQPGAEQDQAIEAARSAGLVVIAGGPCILVAMKTIARK